MDTLLKKPQKIFLIMLMGGLASIFTYALQFNWKVATSVIAMSLIVSSAALAIGGFLGFLFGIPKTLQLKYGENASESINDDKIEGQSSSESRRGEHLANKDDYLANTNLEQISDWLTKILVGVGLVQIPNLLEKLRELGSYLSPAFGGHNGRGSFAIALVIYFSIYGFVVGYLWTRLTLVSQLRRADLEAKQVELEKKQGKLEDKVRTAIDAAHQREQLNAEAFALVTRQLEEPNDPPVDANELNKAIKEASPSSKVLIFHQARSVRNKGLELLAEGSDEEKWKQGKLKIRRTIPIFRALIDSDTHKEFHRNYGQLGFALKDSFTDTGGLDLLREAEEKLSEAIRIRDKKKRKKKDWVTYELNRAICRIKLYGEDKSNERKIVDDLRKYITNQEKLEELSQDKRAEEIMKWISSNSIDILNTHVS